MITRRTFLQGSAAVTGLALTGATLSSSAASMVADQGGPPEAHLPLHTVIYDRSFETSAIFGDAARRQGFSTYAIHGDITDLWTRHLASLWENNPVAIAGLTHHSALFLLERFGWDHGLRVVFRAEHHPNTDSSLAHRLSGPVPMLQVFEAAVAQHDNYGSCVAKVLEYCPGVSLAASTLSIVTRPSPHSKTGSADGPLFSWVIAPHVRSVSALRSVHSTERIA